MQIRTIFYPNRCTRLDPHHKVEGFRRTFSISDTSLHHQYATNSRVSSANLYVIALVAPAAIILLISLIVTRSFWDLHSGWLGLALSLSVTSTVTNIIKITVGRPRPDILDRCQPAPGLTNPTPYTLSDSRVICTRLDLLNDGFRSFPSGHASLSFCGMIYLTFYLAAKVHISNQRGFSWKTWLLLAPISGATLVAISRSMDYRHHATDLIAGSLLGTAIGWYCYRQYYPPLSHPLCHRPYSPRIPRDEEDLDPEEAHADELETLGGARASNSTSSSSHSENGITSSDLERGTLVGGANVAGKKNMGEERREGEEGVPLEGGRPVF
ncbi:phosphatidic acid phosphatase type 2/haloperoxidase [Mrakia frigida]|uniref:phosphatase PAP2 family protein n=1 Tax=Mrakia frigida TaxID=29902 RepID=UPI003FCC096F